MGRGRSTLVRCCGCGRNVSRTKAVSDFRPVRYATELRSVNDVTCMIKRKVYYCVSCGKSLGVYERKKKRAEMQRRY